MTGPTPPPWKSPAQTCRDNGWTVGTRLAGDEGRGETVIEITAVGETHILAKRISHRGEPYNYAPEGTWVLDGRPWRAVPTSQPPQDRAQPAPGATNPASASVDAHPGTTTSQEGKE